MKKILLICCLVLCCAGCVVSPLPGTDDGSGDCYLPQPASGTHRCECECLYEGMAVAIQAQWVVDIDDATSNNYVIDELENRTNVYMKCVDQDLVPN